MYHHLPYLIPVGMKEDLDEKLESEGGGYSRR